MLNCQKSERRAGYVPLRMSRILNTIPKQFRLYSPQRFAAYIPEYQYFSLEGALVFVDGLLLTLHSRGAQLLSYNKLSNCAASSHEYPDEWHCNNVAFRNHGQGTIIIFIQYNSLNLQANWL